MKNNQKNRKSDEFTEDIKLEAIALASQLKEVIDNCENQMCPYYYNAMCIITLHRENEQLKERIKNLEKNIV